MMPIDVELDAQPSAPHPPKPKRATFHPHFRSIYYVDYNPAVAPSGLPALDADSAQHGQPFKRI